MYHKKVSILAQMIIAFTCYSHDNQNYGWTLPYPWLRSTDLTHLPSRDQVCNKHAPFIPEGKPLKDFHLGVIDQIV
jgi:hypothetical protein